MRANSNLLCSTQNPSLVRLFVLMQSQHISISLNASPQGRSPNYYSCIGIGLLHHKLASDNRISMQRLKGAVTDREGRNTNSTVNLFTFEKEGGGGEINLDLNGSCTVGRFARTEKILFENQQIYPKTQQNIRLQKNVQTFQKKVS